ncbi:hypothetical protein RN001_007332 [Aquatica leii]|uniref:Tubulin glycylase 3A n=1 Tax=Aquatica leii TaxID=1421715 RepID=A0AAN7PCZ0_9COLE|nr:hypothetical protein RN001_007332 [Aquatica leii]
MQPSHLVLGSPLLVGKFKDYGLKTATAYSAPPSTTAEASVENSEKAVELNQRSNSTTDIKLRCGITSERLNQLRKCVDYAIRDHKTFTVKGGWQTVRNQFLIRGWVEKFEAQTPAKKQIQKDVPAPSLDEVCLNLPVKQEWESQATYVLKCERTIMSRMLSNHGVDFYWNQRREPSDWHHRIDPNQIMSRFIRSLFTSKEGLNLLLQQLHWHCEPGVASVNFPRCYTLGFPDHYHNFVEDFRLTACVGLLKWLVSKYEKEDELSIIASDGAVSHTTLVFALNRCNEFIASQKHLDIDREIPQTWDHEWNEYLTNYYRIVHDHAVIHATKEWNLILFNAACKTTLVEIKKYMPMIDVDGIKNIWILKPGNKCRGRGIQLIKDVEDVAKIMNLKLKYVVQKYIEKPLLIYQTKFDIRQWFMITSVQPLCIWMYKECYLRFSTQIFTLDNFHESLHLTNHAVQCKYANVLQRDKALPDQNMWDLVTFQNYLKEIGEPRKWADVIYPGIRENIVGVMLACQDTMDRRPNTFELYGADFLLGEDYKPWLLEINSSPDLSPSTNVTKRLCPQCLQDLVKVIIDRRKDPTADTGAFDLVYKQNLPRPPAYLGMNLVIRGRRVFKSKKLKGKDSKEKLHLAQALPEDVLKKNLPQLANKTDYNGPIIGDLIEEIQHSMHSAGSEGYEFVPASSTEKKKFASKQERVSKRECNTVKTTYNKLNFVNRKQSAKEDKILEFGYKNLRSMFIKSAYFGLFSEWKLKNKFAIFPEERLLLNKDNNEDKGVNSMLKENSVLPKFNPQTHKSDSMSNKKYIQNPQRLSCVKLRVSFPQLHKIEPLLDLKRSSNESKKTSSKQRESN